MVGGLEFEPAPLVRGAPAEWLHSACVSHFHSRSGGGFGGRAAKLTDSSANFFGADSVILKQLASSIVCEVDAGGGGLDRGYLGFVAVDFHAYGDAFSFIMEPDLVVFEKVDRATHGASLSGVEFDSLLE
jgi:hypothetical protein